MSSSAPTSRIPVRTRMQGGLVRDPRDPVFAKGVHPVLAGPRRLRASTALERPLATRPDSLLRVGAAGERRVAAIAHAQPSTSHSAPGEGFRFARGWRKQKRWINGRSGDQAEALGDRAAACLIARRCKHHGVAGCARSLWRSPTRGPSGRSLSRNAIAPPAATSVIACVAKRKSASTLSGEPSGRQLPARASRPSGP